MKNLFKFLLSMAISFGVGYLGSLVTTPSISSWYQTLNKPFFTPPNWLFGPVWTILYILMAISAYLIWKGKVTKNSKMALTYYILQLGLNFLWSFFFFGIRQPLIAFISIVILWITIYVTFTKFNKISNPAAILLVPYLLWVGFAGMLNLAIVILN